MTPVEERQIDFYGTTIYAVIQEDGRIMVPIRPICEGLGIDWSAQWRRIGRDEVLSEVLGVAVITTPGGRQDMRALPLEFVTGWLFGISANRVKLELRDNIHNYRRDVYRVIHEAFTEGRLSLDRSFDDALEIADIEVVQAYHMSVAITKLAKSQIMLQAEVGRHEEQLVDLAQRVEAVENQLLSSEYITEGQASQISQAVKAVAMKLGEQSGRNEYGGVYGELYRKFSITSYKLLPVGRFQEAMDFLTDWHQSLVGDEPF
jgi:hypothetical protein